MFKISKKVEYSLMALKFMAEKNELITARELELQFSVPFDTMAKVLQLLNAKGVLESTKGTKGGYTLTKDLYQLTYAQLVEYIEGKKSMMVCLTSKGTICDKHNTCNIISPLDYLNRKTSAFYAQLTIGEILFGEKVKEQKIAKNNLSELLVGEACPLGESEENS
jgi:Rrf2 family protein